jgi:hypothetical protein
MVRSRVPITRYFRPFLVLGLTLIGFKSSVVTSSSTASTEPTPAQRELSDKFLACLEAEAERVKNSNDDVSPMIAQARAIIWLDTLARLHEAGLDEAIKAADATQASAWTRDLALFEIVMGLLRNIQPMDLDAADEPEIEVG